MLKGHAKIELTNVETGEVQVIEHDNMFTKAIENSVNNPVSEASHGISKIIEYNMPVIDNHLGGVVLFEDPIPEDENITTFPEGNNVVGYAGTIVSDGQDKWWGSRNFLETEEYDPVTKSVKYVWDFGTSQANGTISALGLTYGKKIDWYGDSPFSLQYDRRQDVGSLFKTAGIGVKVVEYDGETVTHIVDKESVGQIILKKTQFNFDTVTIDNKIGEAKEIFSQAIAMPLSSANYSGTYWKDGDDGYWYGFFATNSDFSSQQFATTDTESFAYKTAYPCHYCQIIRINKETLTVEHHDVAFPSECYFNPFISNPIITNHFVIFTNITKSSNSGYAYYRDPYTSSFSPSYMYPEQIYFDSAVFVSKQNWVAELKQFVDRDGKKYEMAHGTYSKKGYRTWVAHLRMSSNLKLPNGTYMANDIMLDDEGYVIKQSKPFVYTSLGIPATDFALNTTGYRYSTVPFSLSQESHHCCIVGLILNKKKNEVLHIYSSSSGYLNSSSSGNTFSYCLAPSFIHHLVTINNLDVPVTKTSAQSMKVTYTVSEEVEGEAEE